jgi:hypothetical protein
MLQFIEIKEETLEYLVKQLGVIHRIISSAYDPDSNLELFEQNLTFDNYTVLYQGNTLKLLKKNDIVATDSKVAAEIELRTRHSWQALVTQYGVIRNGISRIRLLQSNGSDLVGTVALHPADDTLMLFTPDADTFPSNTMPPIDAIINPQNINVDNNLLTPAAGTRYLLLHAVGSAADTEEALAWNPGGYPELIANANDIVEFNGVYWIVSFDSQNENKLEYVTNMNTGSQYKWNAGTWAKSVEGRYGNDSWSLTL